MNNLLKPAWRPASTRTLLMVLLLLSTAFATAAPPQAIVPVKLDKDPGPAPFLLVKSPYTLEQTVARVKSAAIGHNFRFIREQSLDYGFVAPELESDRRRVIYLCDFGFLAGALKIEPRIGLFLPCQVNVVESGDGVFIVAPNPKVLSRTFFDNPQLNGACERLQHAYRDILDEATM